jgi:hypothetical protein
MKPEHSSPTVELFKQQLDAVLKDVEGKHSHDEFNATLDYIAKHDPDAIGIGGDESSEGEAAKVVEEFKKTLAERLELLARLRLAQAKRRELLELRDKLRPGRKFSNLAMLVLGEKRFHRYVAPAIADMHVEYYAALAAGENKKARIIVWRFYALMLLPVLRVFLATIKTLFEFAHK